MNIVFDIGNVLVRWDARAAFAALDAAADAFLSRVGFAALNLRGDGGETFADLAAEIADPADRDLFLSYLPNYAATIAEPIEGTWALMDRLRADGHEVRVDAWRGPVTGDDDPIRNATPEGLRAFLNVEDYYRR